MTLLGEHLKNDWHLAQDSCFSQTSSRKKVPNECVTFVIFVTQTERQFPRELLCFEIKI